MEAGAASGAPLVSVRSAMGTGFGGLRKISGISNAGAGAGAAAADELAGASTAILSSFAMPCSLSTRARCSSYFCSSLSNVPSADKSMNGSLSIRDESASSSETLRARSEV